MTRLLRISGLTVMLYVWLSLVSLLEKDVAYTRLPKVIVDIWRFLYWGLWNA